MAAISNGVRDKIDARMVYRKSQRYFEVDRLALTEDPVCTSAG